MLENWKTIIEFVEDIPGLSDVTPYFRKGDKKTFRNHQKINDNLYKFVFNIQPGDYDLHINIDKNSFKIINTL
jgi:hypothetical protein